MFVFFSVLEKWVNTDRAAVLWKPVIGYSEHSHAMNSHLIPEAVVIFPTILEDDSKKKENPEHNSHSHFDQSTSKYFQIHIEMTSGLVSLTIIQYGLTHSNGQIDAVHF